MIEETYYKNPILILTLDRLIKKQFLDNLEKSINQEEKKERLLKKIHSQIEEHNRTLIENLFLPEKQAKTLNKKLQFITRLYGIKDYHPKGNNKGWHGYSIQKFIDENSKVECLNKHILSNYFYGKLNSYIIQFSIGQEKKLPKIKQNRLEVLFDLAIPSQKITNWRSFADHPTSTQIREEIFQELKQKDENLQEFFNFQAFYYSRSRKKIHSFELKFSKEYITEENVNKGRCIITFKDGKLEYSGKVTRKKDKVTAIVEKENKRVIIFAFVPRMATFNEVNIIQGIYIGDSVKKEGEVFSMEFIATKHNFLNLEENYYRIVTALLLRRNNFAIQSFDLTSKVLQNKFSQVNSLDDKLKDIILRTQKSNGIIFFNYGKSGEIWISKIYFEDKLKINLSVAVPSSDEQDGVQIINQTCNLSARDNGKNIIATTYREGHLSNVVVMDFGDPYKKIFEGTFSYHDNSNIFTTYLVAVLDPFNKEISPGKLQTTHKFKEIYKEALSRLQQLNSHTPRF
jgi:hypothetical protein